MPSSSLSRKAVVVAVGVGVQNLISQLAVNMFLVRILGEREIFGSYRQVWLLLNTSLPVFFFGFHFALYYFLPTLAASARRGFCVRCLVLLLGSGILLAVGIFLGARPLAHFFHNPLLVPLFRATSLYALLTVPAMLLFHFLIAVDKVGLATLNNIVYVLAQSVLIVVLCARGVGLEIVFWSLTLLALVRLGQTLFEIRRYTEGKWFAHPGVGWASLWRYALPAGMTGTVAIAGEKLDKFVVSGFLDPGAFALYSVGAVEFPAIVLVSLGATIVMRPRIATFHHSGRREEIGLLWAGAMRKVALVLLPLTAFLALFARELIELLYTPAYGECARVFRIYLLLSLFRILAMEPILSSVGRVRTVFLGGVLFLTVDLGLNLLLVRRLGMSGPAWATVAATALVTVFYAKPALEYVAMPVHKLVPGRAILRILLVALGAGLGALPLKALHWSHAPTLIVGLGLFGGLYLLLGWWGKVLTPDDLLLLRSWFPRSGRGVTS